jgi:PhzF family phenazine biosynthesis protein
MPVPIYQVDAFAETPFAGNPAGVCILGEPADEAWMQHVAREINVSETAFITRRDDGSFDLRWFTPAVEVELCGHGTLAAAHILWETGRLRLEECARFHTRSGVLAATRSAERIELDFPAAPPIAGKIPDDLVSALGVEAVVYVGRPRFDFLVEVAEERTVRSLAPSFGRLKKLGVRGVIVTARSTSREFDFVSRFFAPGAGIDEDPVTGSAHCALTPYWAAKLGKEDLVGYQASSRGGIVTCRLVGDRVRIGGRAVTVLRGEFIV